MRSLFALALIVFLPLAAPVVAAETPWQEVAPDVRMRLISTGQVKAATGKTLIGLEIDMPEATRTYWRVPGETGLPTELDFSGSHGVASHEILWPYPTLEETTDYIDYVYFGPTVLPIEVTLGPGDTSIELEAVLGVCSEICVPAQAQFSMHLPPGEPDRVNGLRIRQALALVPMSWEDGPHPIGNVRYLPGAQMLEVHIGDDDIDPASLIVATQSGDPLFGAPQIGPDANLVLIPVLGTGEETDLVGRQVQLTFMTGMGAFEVSRPVQTGDAE